MYLNIYDFNGQPQNYSSFIEFNATIGRIFSNG